MRFDNVLAQIEAAKCSDSISLDSALCIMSMVAQDVLSNGSSMPDLKVSNIKNLSSYLMRISNTLNRIYEKHESSITGASSGTINSKLHDRLTEIEKALVELEDQKYIEEKMLSQMHEKETALLCLKRETGILHSKLEELQGIDLDRMDCQRKLLEGQVKQRESALALTKEQIRTLEKEQEKLLREDAAVHQKKNELKLRNEELDASVKDLGNLDDQLHSLRAALAQNEQKKAKTLEEISAVQRQIDVCGKENADYIREAQKFRKDLEEKDASRLRAKGGRDEVLRKLQNVQSEEAQLMQEIRTMETQLLEHNGNIADRVTRRDQLTEELQGKKKESDDLIRDVAGLYSQIENLRVDTAEYREKYLVPAQKDLQSAQAAFAEAEEELQALEQKREVLKEKRKNLGADINSNKTMIALAENEVREAAKELEEKEAELRARQELRDRKRQELNHKTQNEIEPLIREVEKLEQDLRELDVETVKKNWQQTLNELEQRLAQTEEIRSCIPDLKKKLEAQTRQRDDARREYNDLESQRQRIGEEHNSCRQQLEALKNQEPEIRACQNRLDTMKMIRQKLMDNTKRLKLDLQYQDDLTEYIDAAQEVLEELRISICSFAEIPFE